MTAKAKAMPAKAEAMPGLGGVSVSIPETVIEQLLVKEEEKAGTRISQLAEEYDPWAVKEELTVPPTQSEKQVALMVAPFRLSAARQAAGLLPLPPGPPPKAVGAVGAVAGYVANPAYSAPWVLSNGEVKRHSKHYATVPRPVLESGWTKAQALTIDIKSRIMMLENALALMAESRAPHSATVGYPPATLGPLGWADADVARWCEIDYDQPRERFIRAEKLRWWARTANSWKSKETALGL